MKGSPAQLPKLEEYVLANITKKIPYGNYVTSESVHALLKEIEKRIRHAISYSYDESENLRDERNLLKSELFTLIKEIKEARK